MADFDTVLVQLVHRPKCKK